MAIGRVNVGGGAGVNLSVTGGATQPAGKENLVWINTDVTITDWLISAKEPAARSDGTALSGGEVWIVTLDQSSSVLNISKDHAVYVYPCRCMQWVSGAWVKKASMVYKNGAWSSFVKYLYDAGEAYLTLTGGWSRQAMKNDNNQGYTDTVPTVTYNAENMVHALSGTDRTGITYTAIKVDLTDYSTLRLRGTRTTGSLAIWSSFGSKWSDGRVAKMALPNVMDVSLDISAITGEKYIGFQLGQGSVSVTQMWLE
jgi:hypothetical protein